jgi:glycosyltransferase involved in cell wall biosynthesis
MVKVSVITVARNHEIGLSKTLHSIVNQNFRDWELLIVVGDSVDNTRAVALAYQEEYRNVRVYDDVESGIYKAMNQGLAVAKGKFVWFMNAGDLFHSSSSLRDAIGIAEELGADLCIGGHSIQGMENRRTYLYSQKRLKKNFFAFTRRGACHQSMIYKTETLLKLGGFSDRYSICADFDSVLKILNGGRAYRLNLLLSKIEPGGGADNNLKFVILERQRVRRNQIAPFFWISIGIPWTILALAKLLAKKVLPKVKLNDRA